MPPDRLPVSDQQGKHDEQILRRFYQMAVYDVLKRADADEVRRVMREHMRVAAHIMVQREARLSEGFLPYERASVQPRNGNA